MTRVEGGGWKAVALGTALATPWLAGSWLSERGDRIQHRTEVRACYDGPRAWEEPQAIRVTASSGRTDAELTEARAGMVLAECRSNATPEQSAAKITAAEVPVR